MMFRFETIQERKKARSKKYILMQISNIHFHIRSLLSCFLPLYQIQNKKKIARYIMKPMGILRFNLARIGGSLIRSIN